MSLFGSLQSGISGLNAQSSAMGAISDNIVNVNTVGYKDSSVAFKTLVTKQTNSAYYSTGGVQGVTKQYVDMQGLLGNNSSSTALAISGKGFFVASQSPNSSDEPWLYTRAGDFSVDKQGYLNNTSGMYLKGWSVMPYDGNPNVTPFEINGIEYMKAYFDPNGNTTYINDNVVDNKNLRPINLKNIAGTASATQQISIGANLPSGDANGAKRSVSALIYDSLGNASNLSLDFTKQYSNAWDLNVSVPNNATNVSAMTEDGKVFSSAGQLEFTDIPQNGSTITITDDESGVDYTFEFTNNPAGVTAPNIAVDLTDSIFSVSDFTKAFVKSIQENVPSGNRFVAESGKISIKQSTNGSSMTIDASKTKSCVQSGAHPDPTTGIPSGIFKIDSVDNDIKNGARIDFVSTNAADYNGKTIVIDGKNYVLTSTPAAVVSPDVAVDISGAISGANIDRSAMMKTLQASLNTHATEPERFVVSGLSLEISPSTTGGNITFDMSAISSAVTGVARDNGSWTTAIGAPVTLLDGFSVGTIAYKGSKVPAVMFNSDGTPKYYNVKDLNIEWANGAKDMTGNVNQGTRVALKLGEEGTSNGLTGLAGTFETNFINQDGAKFGSYAGVNIDANGIVTAMFDNGERRPIAILPVATFANDRGLESVNGNSWMETGESGQPLLRHSGDSGAGTIVSNSLEQSTVDLANEFSNMIVTQRAYSAASKIITASSDMLMELTNLVR